MLYWSATRKQWQTLVLDAYASPGPDSDLRRPDFSVNELAEGRTLFFQQEDNVFGKAAYRMHIRSVSTGRLVFGVENASTIQYSNQRPRAFGGTTVSRAPAGKPQG
jgi:hypothetical protein